VAVIRSRINRIRLGNFGDCHGVGAGVEELRIEFGPGYRVYFGRQSQVFVVLRVAGPSGRRRAISKSRKNTGGNNLNAEDSRDRAIPR
jgi:putative addiction module killer protein